jgi:5'-phosphate synthase pdxT subunit
MKIGVLALQGNFREHINVLRSLGTEAIAVKMPQHLNDLDGLIIPGGESTVMGKLMIDYHLLTPLRDVIASGMPIWGTCAGLVLLARSTDNALAGQPLLATMNIHVCRNAFGTQRESFATDLHIPVLGDELFHAVFIRAPSILTVGEGVEVLASLNDSQGPLVAVRQGSLLGTAFHPEITHDTRFHQYFLNLVQESIDATLEPMSGKTNQRKAILVN